MRCKSGQSILEYAVLLAVIMSAILIMQFYIKRSYQGRLKAGADELGQMYAPNHTTSTTSQVTIASTTTCTGGNCFGVTVPDGETVTQSKISATNSKTESVDAFATESGFGGGSAP